jgi:hypothetical protein
MSVVFTNAHNIPLYSKAWTPGTEASYAGTCVFLVILALILRSLLALKITLEHKWLARARNQRYVVVRSKGTEGGKIEDDADAKIGCLITSRGVEENVKVVDKIESQGMPFRLSVDIPRAALVMVIAGVAYLL